MLTWVFLCAFSKGYLSIRKYNLFTQMQETLLNDLITHADYAFVDSNMLTENV